MTTTTSTYIKIAALAAVAGIAILAFSILPARAQTTTTTTTTTVAVSPFLRDLTLGSQGADVGALQTWLISKGFSIPAGATGYFWTQTRAAVSAFQAAHGIQPTAGYFGPITRGVVNGMLGSTTGSGLPPGCTSTSGYSPVTGVPCSSGGSTGGSTGGLSGGSGRLTNVDELGDVESTVDEGDNDVKVVGVEAKAQDADIEVQRLDVEFDLSGATGSSRLDRYITSASVWLGSKKLATLDASDADKNGDIWTMRFSNLNGIIREGNTGQLYVTVDAVENLDSSDANTSITATLQQDALRAVDSEGVSETYIDTDITNDFTVEEASTGTLNLTEASSNPDDTVVQVDESNSTDDVTLLSLNLRARHQDVTINDLPVDLTVTGTTNVGDVVQSVKLMRGNTTIDTATVSGSGANTRVLFNNLDEKISSDDTNTYDVVATIRRVETTGGGSAFTTGDTIVASTSNNSSWDVEDDNGDQVDPTGSVTGGVITFETTGIMVAKGSITTDKSVGTTPGSGDTTQYAIPFKVTAGEDDLYIDRSVQNTRTPSAAGGGVAWATTTSSNAGVTNQGAANLSASDTNNGDTATSYKVPSGTTRTFTLNVTLTATGTGFTGVVLTGINYDTDSNTNDSTVYYTAGLDTFKTQDVSMTTH